MRDLYADIIIDISARNVDRVFQYRIPREFADRVRVGCQVLIPFGKGDRKRKGYVVAVTSEPDYAPEKTKDILEIMESAVPVQEQLICLAWWMKERYGSTMNQALKMVLPVKNRVRAAEEKTITGLKSPDEFRMLLDEAERKHYRARARLYRALLENGSIPYRLSAEKLGLSMSMLRPLEEKGIIRITVHQLRRNPVGRYGTGEERKQLNQEQQAAVDTVCRDWASGMRGTYLLYGITGSGKTEVYMELIRRVLEAGKQAIVLIPEISLTYQTVMRFYRRFGDRVSVINSRLSAGERYDQLERARNGEIDIMVGPRSALFTPFERLGLIIMDEEHEGAYKSETSPRYHAREVAEMRAEMNGASLVLGSATPSLESFCKARNGTYRLLTLTRRAREESRLPRVHVVDLRKELAEGNRSVFSRMLKTLIEERLKKKEQVILFMNRRGYANFVSCRSCGEAIRCPHCDVSLTYHRNGTLKCHYCGYETVMPQTCPACGSRYIAAFGTGTQKLEAMCAAEFPGARLLRMDADTTSRKGSHEEILQAFAEGEADILIGTQMIVKGHDFPNVTLVGIMAADLSLHAPDFRSAERTFDLLVQASGRAGRGTQAGDVVIQTYTPDHFAVAAAAAQDYESFYEKEFLYRRMMGYPPAVGLLEIRMVCPAPDFLEKAAGELREEISRNFSFCGLSCIGPVDAVPYKVNDIYRKILYIKHENCDILLKIRAFAESWEKSPSVSGNVTLQYDL